MALSAGGRGPFTGRHRRARRIEHGLQLDAAVIALTPEQRDEILAVLQDVQIEGLGELRGALTRDALERFEAPSFDGWNVD